MAPWTWRTFGHSVIGAAHVRKGRPNQDSVARHDPGTPGAPAIVAVSDGHGAAAHFRSDVGSRLAVETAIACLLGPDGAAQAGLSPRQVVDRVPGLVEDVVSRWTAAVRAHASAHPAEEGAPAPRDGAPLMPYGATLLAAAAMESALVVLQIGDGDILVGFDDGRLVRPLPRDEGLVGEQTYSLCMPGAERYFHTTVLSREEADPVFVMASTDGVSKSFPSDRGFEGVANDYFELARTVGLQKVAGDIPGWLGELTARGSGDDVTLAFLSRA